MPRYINLLDIIFYQAKNNNNNNLKTPNNDSYTINKDSKTIGRDPRLELINNKVDQIFIENELCIITGDFKSQTNNDMTWDVLEDRLMLFPLSKTN